MKSLFNRLQERAKLWGLKEAFSGGSNYSAPRPSLYCEGCDVWHPLFDHVRPRAQGMQPGEFKIRKKEPRGSDSGNDARSGATSVPSFPKLKRGASRKHLPRWPVS